MPYSILQSFFSLLYACVRACVHVYVCVLLVFVHNLFNSVRVVILNSIHASCIVFTLCNEFPLCSWSALFKLVGVWLDFSPCTAKSVCLYAALCTHTCPFLPALGQCQLVHIYGVMLDTGDKGIDKCH